MNMSKPLLNKSKPTKRHLFEIQKAVVWCLYSAIPLRLTWADLHVGKPPKDTKENYLYRKRGKAGAYVVQLERHKTARHVGRITHTLPKACSRLLNKFLPIRDSLVEHDYLLSNLNGSRMTKNGLSKFLTRSSEAFLGKKISAQMIRILFASERSLQLDIADKTRSLLGHAGLNRTLEYVRK